MTAGRLKIWNEDAGEWEYTPGGDGGGGSQPVRSLIVPLVPGDAAQVTGSVVDTLAEGEVIVLGNFNIPVAWDGDLPLAQIFSVGADPVSEDLGVGSLDITDTQLGSTDIYTPQNSLTQASYAVADTPLFLRVRSNEQDAITDVDQGTKTFTVAGDQTGRYPTGIDFNIGNSTGNNGIYTVVSATLNAGDTDIVVVEAIPDGTVDGNIFYGDPQSTTGTAYLVVLIQTAS